MKKLDIKNSYTCLMISLDNETINKMIDDSLKSDNPKEVVVRLGRNQRVMTFREFFTKL